MEYIVLQMFKNFIKHSDAFFNLLLPVYSEQKCAVETYRQSLDEAICLSVFGTKKPKKIC